MPHDDPALRWAELTATRLCHDMASPVGTLINALEMLGEGGGDDALALAHEAAQGMGARLKLLRAAWGGTGALSAAEVMALASGLPGSGRVRAEVSLAADLPPALAQIALNMLLLGVEALPFGGGIVLSGDAHHLTVTVQGRRITWPALPHHGALPEDARHMQAPLLARIAHQAGVSLHLEGGELRAVAGRS